jgi:manganese transport protein
MKAKQGKLYDIFRYLGPGILVTVGFIDPGNWAANLAAGAGYGNTLLWMVTLSTIMLIILQHNAAHLGIVTGLCLSEASSRYVSNWAGKTVLYSAMLATVATALAEITGGAIALFMLFRVPLNIGAVIIALVVWFLIFHNSYAKLEKIIIGFVSLIGLAFLYELSLVQINWGEVAVSAVMPVFPDGSIPVIMSVLGAVVMPHNLFLHSEIIQSRQWNREEPKQLEKQLKFEFLDTLFSMIIGWAINSAMIIVAAATFFVAQVNVDDLGQAAAMLQPLLGGHAAAVFAVALLFAGIASSVTAGMAGGTIGAGITGRGYTLTEKATQYSIAGTLVGAVVCIFAVKNTFQALLISQILLSVQLPFTILLQIYLTSSRKVMGIYVNPLSTKIILWIIAVIVIALNALLLVDIAKNYI